MADAPFQPVSDPFSAGQPPAGTPLTVVAQFLKDMSFESPNMPALLEHAGRIPQGLIKVDVNARKMPEERRYEVVLSLRAEARHQDQVAYIVELQYGGLFQLGPVAANITEPLLLIEAPRLLFPFAREIVANTIQQAGFRAMLIHPIDFALHYREQRAAGAGAGPVAN
ncbi:MAG TPA: protein-export chaperone SecB [Hypericibacter adhaerens]|jgi:preprotein translocase subunit SecB|uniref:Protein-export protein SecB n=1 Tax=Hypericibacter adhaerens TaxID=2602016 RepID=A0A5J6N4U8_9PROT|nr:protein-export chaperone SecB [Hypericibacter adhaerens]QEX25092.1 protein-export protein SecB [Hypericibacter adhaerens]HWA41984.1 protein-export chaperone SecB [Hypericibacter adhaerens]